MITRVRRHAPGIHLPLARLVLCLDCDECFEIGYSTCPACGSETWVPLARFLEIVPAGSARRSREAGLSKRLGPRNADEEREIAQHLLVVARNRHQLYDHLKNTFSGNETIRVITDRRSGERRRGAVSSAAERRRHDRRARPTIDDQLRAIGWSLVLLDLAKRQRTAAL
jgi:hypothetical protein